MYNMLEMYISFTEFTKYFIHNRYVAIKVYPSLCEPYYIFISSMMNTN